MVVASAGVIAVVFRDYWQLQNFHVIEAGAIYRGAEQKPGPLRRMIREYGIRTIICLVDADPDEQAVAKSCGVRWIWLPIGESALELTFDTLEECARVVSDSRNQPVFYHCKRGVYRSNLAQAVYRMKYCGWTIDESLAELRSVGFDPAESGGDNCCADVLRKYYDERICVAADFRQDSEAPSGN
jgi:protein tyrosine phosphatase (PTP) superfamily phosphohydrolase (DUF442 family)